MEVDRGRRVGVDPEQCVGMAAGERAHPHFLSPGDVDPVGVRSGEPGQIGGVQTHRSRTPGSELFMAMAYYTTERPKEARETLVHANQLIEKNFARIGEGLLNDATDWILCQTA